jgi:hypothetical protein
MRLAALVFYSRKFNMLSRAFGKAHERAAR